MKFQRIEFSWRAAFISLYISNARSLFWQRTKTRKKRTVSYRVFVFEHRHRHRKALRTAQHRRAEKPQVDEACVPAQPPRRSETV